MPFDLPDHLLSALREAQPNRGNDPLLREHDAFMLDPGLGPALILTSDGRVLEDGTCWDGTPIRELEGGAAFEALVVGAKKTKIAALLELLPPRPPEAADCSWCHGKRFAPPPVKGATPEQVAHLPTFICTTCHGLGWLGR
jgi:hypothetical protein